MTQRLAIGASEFACISRQARFYKKSEAVAKLIKACQRCKSVNPFVSDLLGEVARRVTDECRSEICQKIRDRKNTINSASKRVYTSVEESQSRLRSSLEPLLGDLPEDHQKDIREKLKQQVIDSPALLQVCKDIGFTQGEAIVSNCASTLEKKCEEVVKSLREKKVDSTIVGVVAEQSQVSQSKLRENNKKWYHFNHANIRFFCKIDGLTEINGIVTPVELKTRRNQIFERIPDYERIQNYIIMKSFGTSQILVRQIYGDETSETLLHDYECQPCFTKAYSDFILELRENNGVEKMCRRYIDMASDDEIAEMYHILFA